MREKKGSWVRSLRETMLDVECRIEDFCRYKKVIDNREGLMEQTLKHWGLTMNETSSSYKK